MRYTGPIQGKLTNLTQLTQKFIVTMNCIEQVPKTDGHFCARESTLSATAPDAAIRPNVRPI